MGTVRRLVAPAPDGRHGHGVDGRVVPAMRKLADEGIPVTLALSLHAPDGGAASSCRSTPGGAFDETLDAARHYFEVTGRRVSIEYALIQGHENHAWRADLLGEKLNARGRGRVHRYPIPPT